MSWLPKASSALSPSQEHAKLIGGSLSLQNGREQILWGAIVDLVDEYRAEKERRERAESAIDRLRQQLREAEGELYALRRRASLRARGQFR